MSNHRYSLKRFIAIDGESFTHRDTHKYVLMAASTEQYVFDNAGLSTVRCFEFLLDLKRKYPQRDVVFVAFGLNYDVNMMLGDLAIEELVQLWEEGRTKHKGYILNWIPSKWFSIRSHNVTVRIYDVFGFFQTSFVNALKKWDLQPLGEIEEMKQKRSSFSKAEKQRVINYCIAECVALVELMDELELALDAVDIRVGQWLGAGAIASSLMKREKVKKHLVHDSDFPEPVHHAITHSYFGGRSELFQQGDFLKIWDYDISSAYPYQATKVPSLVGGEWEHTTTYKPEYPYAIYKVNWDTEYFLTAFPHREKGRISYPQNGIGWYHAAEVAAGFTLIPNDIEVMEGWIFHPATDEKPFGFIPELYKYRQSLKEKNHAGEKCIKLGINALYGKLAQGYGYRDRSPAYQSYFWAGFMTAGTRARVIELMTMAPDNLVMVATDGIFFDKPIDVDLTPGLGGLELTTMDNMFVAQPGVYSGDDGNGNRIGRTRGFFSREIQFDQLEELFRKEGWHGKLQFDVNRFVGVGSCMVRRDFSQWRKWVDSTRGLSLCPSTKFPADLFDDGHSLSHKVTNPCRHIPPKYPPEEVPESEPYKPKRGNQKLDGELLKELVESIQGFEQPLKEY